MGNLIPKTTYYTALHSLLIGLFDIQVGTWL